MLNSLRLSLASFLSVLFFALSFNAYACLLPIYGTTPAPMAHDCSTPPDEQPPLFPYCDKFKTLGVQSASDDQVLCQTEAISLVHHVILTSHSNRLSNHPIVGSARDLLLKICVLRI